MDPAAVVAAALDDVVDRRAEPARLLEPEPELDALDDVDAHDRRGERGVEPAVPVDVDCRARSAAPWTTTSKTPPTVSPFERASSIRAIIRASASGSGQRSGEASASSRDRVALRRVDGDAADLGRERPDLDAELAQERPGDAAGRDPGRVSRADARSRTLRTSSKPYFRAPARSAWPGRTRVTGVARLLPLSAARRELGRLRVARAARPA